MASEKKVILEVKNLKKYFPVKQGLMKKVVGHVRAVDDVSFQIYEGETFGLVGETGCGKSTTGRAILRLFEPTSGSVKYCGKEVLTARPKEMIELRKQMQIVFQDPYSSLNPRMTIGETVGEALIHHKIYRSKAEINQHVIDIVEMCGLDRYYINRYPHEFSGGQRQRIGIARALALNPSFLVADEPVSALDVSIQAQIINLLRGLQEKMGLSYLFISHDLSVVKYLSDRVGVMYLGSLVEVANKDEIYKAPKHPYTQALLSSIPIADPTKKKDRIILSGEIPSPSNPPSGCKFHTRCPHATELCKTNEPEFRNMGNEHYVMCHYAKI